MHGKLTLLCQQLVDMFALLPFFIYIELAVLSRNDEFFLAERDARMIRRMRAQERRTVKRHERSCSAPAE